MPKFGTTVSKIDDDLRIKSPNWCNTFISQVCVITMNFIRKQLSGVFSMNRMRVMWPKHSHMTFECCFDCFDVLCDVSIPWQFISIWESGIDITFLENFYTWYLRFHFGYTSEYLFGLSYGAIITHCDIVLESGNYALGKPSDTANKGNREWWFYQQSNHCLWYNSEISWTQSRGIVRRR